jgi:hypothetical protein
MGVGAFFLLIVVIVVVVLIALVLTGNAGWLGWRGSDPKRQPPPGTTAESEGAPSSDERPTHTVVDLEQSAERETRGVPTD